MHGIDNDAAWQTVRIMLLCVDFCRMLQKERQNNGPPPPPHHTHTQTYIVLGGRGGVCMEKEQEKMFDLEWKNRDRKWGT